MTDTLEHDDVCEHGWHSDAGTCAAWMEPNGQHDCTRHPNHQGPHLCACGRRDG